MRAVHANLSPIFAIYDDPTHVITRRVDAVRSPEPRPLLDVRDADGTDHRLWRIDDEEVLDTIASALAERPLVIADGHHRYETAMAYRDERRAADGDPAEPQPYDFAPVYLANRHDPGLEPFATHRVVTGVDPGGRARPRQAPRLRLGRAGDRRAASRRSSEPSRPRPAGCPRSACGAARAPAEAC